MYLVADGFQARPHPTCWGLEREFFAGKRSSWVLLSEGSLLYETFLVGLNACEQLGGWLVFWVLEDEFAAYGKVEGKLAEVVDGVGGCGDPIEVTQQERGEASRMKLPSRRWQCLGGNGFGIGDWRFQGWERFLRPAR